jgi:hypothetical protein
LENQRYVIAYNNPKDFRMPIMYGIPADGYICACLKKEPGAAESGASMSPNNSKTA